MSILHMPPPTTPPQSQNLSSLLTHTFSHLSMKPLSHPRPTTLIRMGGGPRTFPGGVSKWQWKRMQQKKQKQLLKARLCRERQIYEMRKRAELRASVSELERPWEVVERAPTLFSVRADEQLKTLADRFHRPGGWDMWSESDGPQLFSNVDGMPTARFLPKGAVHSVKPYGVRRDGESDGELVTGRGRGRGRGGRKGLGFGRRGSGGGGGGDELSTNSGKGVESGLNNLRGSSGREEMGGEWLEGDGKDSSLGSLRAKGAQRNVEPSNSYGLNSEKLSYFTDGRRGGKDGKGSSRGSLRTNGVQKNVEPGNSYGLDSGKLSYGREERGGERYGNSSSRGSLASKGIRRKVESGNSEELSNGTESNGRVSLGHRGRTGSGVRRYNSGRDSWKPKISEVREVYDMSLKQDGSYGLQSNQHQNALLSDGLEDDFELDRFN